MVGLINSIIPTQLQVFETQNFQGPTSLLQLQIEPVLLQQMYWLEFFISCSCKTFSTIKKLIQ